ncbi:dimeric alpha-beta barrel [Colletotrichum tofieldiae]|nr:dimeric alpha-beta barrel [Colletotrichum tofieldiae]
MSGPPGPTRVILDVKGGVDDWKEAYKQFLLTMKGSDGYNRYRWDRGRATTPSSRSWHAFGTSPDHARAVEAVRPIIKAIPSKCPRFDLDVRTYKPPPQEFLNSPLCEVVTVTHCTGDPAAMQARLVEAEKQDGCLAAHSGVAATDTPDKGTVWIGFIGWKSYEHAKKADKGTYLPEGCGELEHHCLNFNFPIKGYSVTNPGK